MSVKSSTELMLYVVLTMPTLNKAYLLFIIYSLTIICCCQVQNYMWFLGKRETVNAWKKADFDGFREKDE
jgi:hypothetical protein